MYNGWQNYETWNVALWLSNDEGLYSIMRECENFGEVRKILREEYCFIETPDRVALNDSGLDLVALDELVQESK
jgi:hypothetical protein